MPAPPTPTIQEAMVSMAYMLYLLIIEWGSAITGQRAKKATWLPAYKWLVILCWATALMETSIPFLEVLKLPWRGVYSVWAYIETGWIICIQRSLVVHRWAKRSCLIVLIVLTVVSAVTYIWGPPVNALNVPFQLFTLFIQLIATCVALADILGNVSDRTLSSQPAFWLAAGMLFYSSIFAIVHIVELYFDATIVTFFYAAFSTVANTCMYGGFIACFITLRRADRQKSPDNTLTSAA